MNQTRRHFLQTAVALTLAPLAMGADWTKAPPVLIADYSWNYPVIHGRAVPNTTGIIDKAMNVVIVPGMVIDGVEHGYLPINTDKVWLNADNSISFRHLHGNQKKYDWVLRRYEGLDDPTNDKREHCFLAGNNVGNVLTRGFIRDFQQSLKYLPMTGPCNLDQLRLLAPTWR